MSYRRRVALYWLLFTVGGIVYAWFRSGGEWFHDANWWLLTVGGNYLVAMGWAWLRMRLDSAIRKGQDR